MISYDKALEIIAGEGLLRTIEKRPLIECLGRVSSETVRSAHDSPPFDNSAMDGFAVRHADVRLASAQSPVGLHVIGTVTAGSESAFEGDLRGKAVQIMTGAPIPAGFDCVLPLETVSPTSNRVLIPYAPERGDHIRRTGEDITTGSLLLRAGERISAETMMLAASAGVASLQVFKQPDVIVFSTGDEVAETTAAVRAKGGIYDANGPYLVAAAQREGLSARFGGRIADSLQALKTQLKDLQAGTLVISTGGVSAGVHDFVPELITKMGGEILFHKVAIKPGKPILFARLPGGGHYFGLPGNPAAAAVGFRFFVIPFIRALQNLPTEKPLTARLNASVSRKNDLTLFLKASVALNLDNGLWVDPLDGQESFKTMSLAKANAFIRISGNASRLTVATYVDVFPIGCQFPFHEAL